MLSVEALEVHYGGIKALRGIDLSVGQGELVALIGANGAGKTTLLKAVSGLVPSTGSVIFDGEDMRRERPEMRARQGLVQVPEGRRIFPRMSVTENLLTASWGRRQGVAEDVKRVQELFPILAERGSQMASTLSGGEQQMLALGRALIRQPKVLMLDEPSMGLAPLIVQEVFRLIELINQEGVTVLLVEQNAVKALGIANRAYVLEHGQIVLQGAASELAKSPEVTQAYLGGAAN